MSLLKTSGLVKEIERLLEKKPAVFLVGVNKFFRNFKHS